MDLIGSINHIESRLGERKPDRSKGKPAHKNPRTDAADENHATENTDHSSAEYDTGLGGKLDTTA